MIPRLRTALTLGPLLVLVGLAHAGSAAADDACDVTEERFEAATGVPVTETVLYEMILQVPELELETVEIGESGQVITFGPLSADTVAARKREQAQHRERQAAIATTLKMAPEVWSLEAECPPGDRP